MLKAKGVPTEELARRPLTILLRCDRHLLIARRRPRTDDAGRGNRAETVASRAVFIQGASHCGNIHAKGYF